MDHAESSPDQVAKIVFWTIFVSTMMFIGGVIALIR